MVANDSTQVLKALRFDLDHNVPSPISSVAGCSVSGMQSRLYYAASRKLSAYIGGLRACRSPRCTWQRPSERPQPVSTARRVVERQTTYFSSSTRSAVLILSFDIALGILFLLIFATFLFRHRERKVLPILDLLDDTPQPIPYTLHRVRPQQ